MLHVEGLRKSYGEVVALRGVDLSVPAGEIVSLLGPNGAGKTTLVSIVAGLRSASAGSVEVDGIDALARSIEARRRIGLAPQDLGVYPVVTVRQNLALFGELAGLRRPELDRRIEEVAEALDITELLDRLAGSLSGGQKRRVHTAIALLHKPALLMLDEATVGADVETRHHLLSLVRSMAEEGTAILYSTHYLHEVEELGASVAIIDQGRIIARGSVGELVRRHATPTVEVVFDGTAPPVPDGMSGEGSGDTLRVETAGAGIPTLMQQLGDDVGRIRSVEVVGASLEGVYLSLTGKHYRPEGAADEDGPGSVAMDPVASGRSSTAEE